MYSGISNIYVHISAYFRKCTAILSRKLYGKAYSTSFVRGTQDVFSKLYIMQRYLPVHAKKKCYTYRIIARRQNLGGMGHIPLPPTFQLCATPKLQELWLLVSNSVKSTNYISSPLIYNHAHSWTNVKPIRNSASQIKATGKIGGILDLKTASQAISKHLM